MANLAQLLEQDAGQRMNRLPRLTPSMPSAPLTAPVTQTETSGGLQSLLPLLANRQGGGGGGGQQSSAPGDPKDWEVVAEQIGADKYGYNNNEFNKLDSIIERESSWDPHAYNENSGAAGIAQRISGWGPGYRENIPETQINWLYRYIEDRYGNVAAALRHKNQTGWY